MLTGVKDIGFVKIRAKEAQEVANDCQTQEDFRVEKSKKRGWDRQHHHGFTHVQGNGDNSSGLEDMRDRKKGRMSIFIHSFNILSAYSVSGTENLMFPLKYLLRHLTL